MLVFFRFASLSQGGEFFGIDSGIESETFWPSLEFYMQNKNVFVVLFFFVYEFHTKQTRDRFTTEKKI